ncbi:hypothetical protein M422DRAFT_255341 [Sphaerobolus stellatus SS14]|uniref:Uncharacterized protein n=1 Tax=Sphaerobolus stellatus (strain SS14) TaxID=990650 RepID=A0A0C9V475_SPHS4|nr:hypothetical protein M422DRAFT_255341 [Sphaerobolus stellatus SS14]
METISQLEVLFVTTFEDAQIIARLAAAASALLVFDILLTLNDEVNHFVPYV